MSKHPIQPLEMVKDVLRFKENPAVNALYVKLEQMGIDPWNVIQADPKVTKADLCQFAQLIGYSHSGSGGLSYVDDQTWYAAQNAYKGGTSELEARNLYLEKRHQKIVKKLAPLCSHVFDIHLDDLEPR
jgi:hypothetical protein